MLDSHKFIELFDEIMTDYYLLVLYWPFVIVII